MIPQPQHLDQDDIEDYNNNNSNKHDTCRVPHPNFLLPEIMVELRRC
jgi:hypothetical protein